MHPQLCGWDGHAVASLALVTEGSAGTQQACPAVPTPSCRDAMGSELLQVPCEVLATRGNTDGQYQRRAKTFRKAALCQGTRQGSGVVPVSHMAVTAWMYRAAPNT